MHPVEVGEALGELLEEGEVGEELAEAEGVEVVEGVESLVLEVVPGLLLYVLTVSFVYLHVYVRVYLLFSFCRNRIVTLVYLLLAVVKKTCWSPKI